MATEQHRRPASQSKLPVGLAGVLNDENRDSAYYSNTSSKHTSAASGFGIPLYHSAQDKTPSPTTNIPIPHALVSPSSHMSVASMVSPTSSGMGRFDRPQSLESVHGIPLGGTASAGPESRRESVDSRMNQNFNDMRLSGSPYTSQNQSTTSIQGTLAQQRNPRVGQDHHSLNRMSNGYQPSMERTPDGLPKVARTAPAITGPATSTIARAAEPTKGQAWAFPEEEIHRMPNGGTFLDSRRSSIADSIASSQFTTESRLPPGQRRLDDGLGPDYHRLSTNSTDLQTIHHHSLQHKQLSDMHSEESSPQGGAQPYSRTPELRVSHKLAERKRRTEMKELFEQLRDLMPQERGSKASKWEILTKAIAEHQRLSDNIKSLSGHCQNALQENERLRMENAQLRGGTPAMPPGQGPASQPPQQAPADSYAQDPYGRAPRPELPPLRALSNNLPNPPDSMTGVQYEGQRLNGYRQERY
ncbi:Uu.00g038620.m01.CDS01 [Anthostomella pinea]|uniref:Uu.00g038620.m01.CDS01 n=1 Tax=Anthostomella pinea TaxID=933095 RepID=A0AAI8V9Q2_9PEZI|nr:Uu.00g038620.m01.CDS01 [Anthostomella pinea]